MKFDVRQTNIAKGVAILLLLWHHLFYNVPNNYSLFTPLFYVKGIPIECLLSDFCKVCVSIFLLLSGYGLYKSWQKNQAITIRENNNNTVPVQVKFVLRHLLKLMSGFWLVYILFVPLSIWFGVPFWTTYQNSFLFGIIDFLGLSFLFNTPTVNATWWFMTPIIVYYIIFPFLVKIANYSKELLVIVSAFILLFPLFYKIPGQLSTWLLPFSLGIVLAKDNLIEKIKIRNKSFMKGFWVSVSAIILFAFLKYIDNQRITFDSLFAIAIILFCFFVLSKIPVLNKILEQLGKNSGMIFMFHTFIFDLYFKDFIYWFKYAPLIFIVMVVVCYLIAVGLEWLKRIIRVDKLINLIMIKG